MHLVKIKTPRRFPPITSGRGENRNYNLPLIFRSAQWDYNFKDKYGDPPKGFLIIGPMDRKSISFTYIDILHRKLNNLIHVSYPTILQLGVSTIIFNGASMPIDTEEQSVICLKIYLLSVQTIVNSCTREKRNTFLLKNNNENRNNHL